MSLDSYSIRELVFDTIGALDYRTPKKRDYVRSSEIGGAFINTYLSMRGVAPTQRKDPRGLFGMSVGNSVEYGITNGLVKAGLARVPDSERPVILETPGLLTVHGREDLVIEVADWDTQKAKVQALRDMGRVDDHQAHELEIMLAQWQERRPGGLRRTIVDVKSKNDVAYLYAIGKRRDPKGGLIDIPGFNVKEKNRDNLLQLLTYMKFYECDNGAILLVNKNAGMAAKGDDKSMSARFFDMAQIDLTADDPYINKEWTGWMQEMTYYHRNNIIPPLDKMEPWRIDYSDYRDLIILAQKDSSVIQLAIDNL